ncbi:deoxyribonuclease [Halobacteriales archaeon QS_3_64_16]|nr:MAG: deoxyribonuclease [Halobacteriales archaeon QS_3_64_16]
MEISDKLLCLFSASVTETEDSYVIEVPRREIETGSVDSEEIYRVALVSQDPSSEEAESGSSGRSASGGAASGGQRRAPSEPQPPVEIGEVRYVEIEDIGKQGDGIARVERGYVIIVPGAEVDERVKIEVSEVKSNFAVGEVIEDDSY